MSTPYSNFSFSTVPDDTVSNYQRAIVKFRRDPELIPIGAFLASMTITADDRVGTACTDGIRKIIYSPKYFDSLTVDQCVSALIHEVKHKYLNFFPRFERWAPQYKGRYSRQHLLRTFNVAQDYFINYMIKHQWKLPLGDGWLYNVEYRPDLYTTEGIANKLLAENHQPEAENPQPPQPEGEDDGDNEGDSEDSSGGEGNSTDPSEEEQDTGDEGEEEGDDGEGAGSGGDDDEDEDDTEGDSEAGDDSEAGKGDDIMLPDEYDGDIENVPDEGEMRDMETEMREDVSNAVRAAKAADPRRAGDEATDPFSAEAAEAAFSSGFDFRSELMRWANAAHNKGRYTWFRPNRRLKTSQGIPLPSRHGKQLGTVIFVIDSSGSTDGEVVRLFLDEATQALRTLDYKKAVILWCSEYVAKAQEFTKEEVDARRGSLFDGIIHRKGFGTNFPPAFEYIAEHYKDARCITYLTDGGVGVYDVTESKEIISRDLNNAPVLWLLFDDVGYAYVERFVGYVKDHNCGRCAFLPAHLLNE